MGHVKKSTRKFESKHLTRTLDDRKAHKKTKQAFLLREKKKQKRQAARGPNGDDGDDDGTKDGQPKAKKQNPDGPRIFDDMSVEEFFAGGFEVPEAGVTKKAKAKGKRKRDEKEDEEMADAKGGGDHDDGDDHEHDEDDEVADHKNELNALAENDPAFYKYLKENDPELLDFATAERDDLSSIDELSEGEETSGNKKGKKQKEKGDGDEVSVADVKKWREGLVDKKSLRSLRQVVLAFRAAAHVNDVEEDAKQGGFKYTITNPDGTLLPAPCVFSFFFCNCMMIHTAGTSPRDLYSSLCGQAAYSCPWRGADF